MTGSASPQTTTGGNLSAYVDRLAQAGRARRVPVVAHAESTPTPAACSAVGLGKHGWASALSIEPSLRSRLVERLAVIDPANDGARRRRAPRLAIPLAI